MDGCRALRGQRRPLAQLHIPRARLLNDADRRLYAWPVPEGDTIRYAVNRMRPVLEGVVPDEIRTPQARHGRDRWPERLSGRRVEAADAHGKHLFLRFA